MHSFRANDSGIGRASLRKFDPSWVFLPRFSTELEMILERFTEGAVDNKYDPVHFLKWLGDWEKVYVKAGLGVSGHWSRVGRGGITGKKRFVQQILLRLAIRMQGHHFALAAPVLWRWQSEKNNFIDFFSAEIYSLLARATLASTPINSTKSFISALSNRKFRESSTGQAPVSEALVQFPGWNFSDRKI